jgi:hypothetical protein
MHYFHSLLYTACAAVIAGTAGAMTFPPVSDLPEQQDLPDPFASLSGEKIGTAEQWMTVRRPEIQALVQHYMYGFAPDAPKVAFTVDQVYTDVLDGKATLKEVTISFPELGEGAPAIHLALFLPNKAEGPVPVFLGLNKCGNHTVLSDPRIAIDEDAWRHDNCEKAEGRGAKEDFWCVPYLISRGYGLATFHESNIDPDRHDFTDGIHAKYELPQEPGAQWGTLRAWAWGLSRCVDYLVTDTGVAGNRIALIGHSRRGKTALLATALDDRVAMVVPHQSGTGGMALSRDNDEETVKRINTHFPHWFNDNFTHFNDNEYALPFDQHLVISLVAPRPLMETSGLKDTWANYKSSLKAIQAADPVYKLLGSRGILDDGMLEAEKVTRDSAGPLLQYRLDTRHTLTEAYWQAILDFADLYMTGK